MKKLILLVIVIILTLGISTNATASSIIADAIFYGTIRATNTGAAAENVSANVTISTPDLIASGIINSSANNTAILNSAGSDTAFMPGYLTNPWVVWYPSISANSTVAATLYTNATGGKIRYFPDDTGMTTTDSASLELGDNFTIEQSGWIDTDNGTDKNFTYKEGAVKVFVSPIVSGNTTSDFLKWETPTGHTDVAGTWTDETKAYDDSTATFAYSSATDGTGGAWVTKEIRLTHVAISTDRIRYWVNKNSTFITQIDVDAYYDGDWHDVFEGTPTWGAWQTKTLGDTYEVSSVRIYRFYHSGNPGDWDYLKLYELDYGVWGENEISLTGVASGEYDIKVEARSQSDKWATGDVLYFNTLAEVDCGAIHNASAKLWISLWYKPNAATGGASRTLFAKRIDATHYLRIYVDNSGNVYWRNNNGTTAFNINVSSGGAWVAGQTYHILASLGQSTGGGAASTGARLRVDNGTASTSSSTTAAPNGGNFWISNWITNDGAEGVISNVIVGTDDLTAAEETALYNGTAPGDETNYWYLDERTGTAIEDFGSGGNDGTADASCSWTTSTYTGSDKTGRFCDYVLSLDDTTQRVGMNIFSLRGLDVNDNSNDWTFLENNAMPYMEYQKIWVGGTLQQYIEWEYDATFTDLSGNSHDATPSFRSTSSDADVSATLVSFTPIELAQVSETDALEWPTMVTDAPDEPTTSYSENATPGIFFEPFVKAIATAAAYADSGDLHGMSAASYEAIFWYNFAFFFIIAGGLMIYYFFATNKKEALLIKCIAMLAIMIFWALPGPNIYGMYVPLYFGLWCFGVLVLSRSYGW